MTGFTDPKEWRIQLTSGIGWEVIDESGKRSVYIPEEFHRLFELGANTAKAVDDFGTVHYS